MESIYKGLMENTVLISTYAPSNSVTDNQRSQPHYLHCSCFNDDDAGILKHKSPNSDGTNLQKERNMMLFFSSLVFMVT
ncbi:hypothetical protein H5410_023334 [Solanum commersonii]|uniref:Uncharacterized protein n=1 Tax=Solanum commersonii TaxID=4109 RepID=A0A9J5ZHZ5_SOLCO|nr:hypothetical protein H5410_023334 [Solanum commersonii]